MDPARHSDLEAPKPLRVTPQGMFYAWRRLLTRLLLPLGRALGALRRWVTPAIASASLEWRRLLTKLLVGARPRASRLAEALLAPTRAALRHLERPGLRPADATALRVAAYLALAAGVSSGAAIALVSGTRNGLIASAWGLVWALLHMPLMLAVSFDDVEPRRIAGAWTGGLLPYLFWGIPYVGPPLVFVASGWLTLAGLGGGGVATGQARRLVAAAWGSHLAFVLLRWLADSLAFVALAVRR